MSAHIPMQQLALLVAGRVVATCEVSALFVADWAEALRTHPEDEVKLHLPFFTQAPKATQ